LASLKKKPDAHLTFEDVTSAKNEYGHNMQETYLELLLEINNIDPNTDPRQFRQLFKKWYTNFDNVAQRWFEGICKHAGVTPTWRFGDLPHVSSFLNYLLTKIYERFVHCIPDRPNDLYDRGYAVDASVVDILVTNDGAFTRTCLRMPKRAFEVLNLDDLSRTLQADS
jgi:hypothetical protein